MNRRMFLGTLGVATLALGTRAAFTPSIEHTRRRVTLWGDGAPALRIAHLSDLHSSDDIPLDHIASAIDLALRDQPDLICVTGDFVTGHAPDPAGFVAALRRLADAAPTFACLGNHDGGRWAATRGEPATPDAVVELLEAAGVRVLRDASEAVAIRDREVLLTGVEDLWSFDIDPKRLGLTADSRKRIVLAHNPDTKDAIARFAWDLMLSGHTHGGQIRLPFVGGRLTAPVADDRFIEGLHSWGGRLLHISRGIGSLHGIRINCPPEVTLLDVA